MNESSIPHFQWRGFTSVFLGLSFAVLSASGVVLFLAPPGRVANWTNWSIFGLRKSEWGGLHIWFATTFLAATAAHLVFNWRPLLGYFKDRVTRRLGTRREWLVALGTCAVVFAGTRMAMPPFSSLLVWNEALKESWEKPAEQAPIPHAELLTLAALGEKSGFDVPTAVQRLKAAGIKGVAPDVTVQALAEESKMSAQQLYRIVKAAPTAAGEHGEGKAGGGIGWKTLRQYCADEKIDLGVALQRLSVKGIAAEESAALRDLASRSGRKPYELVELIRQQ